MTHTLSGADIRGYYAELSIELPGWARTEASIRCFADPDAHERGDRDPSCSVNLLHGAWHCHACGANGGAFDAAMAAGYTPRSAIDLMIRHGLAERRREVAAGELPKPTRRREPGTQRRASTPAPRGFAVTEADVERWQAALATERSLIVRLADDRAWRYPTMRALGLGLDSGRITIPTRDQAGALIGLLRYFPWPAGRGPKIRAERGSRRALLPHPAAEPSADVLLVEGEPDMIAARSHNLPAIAVPGVDGWRREWAAQLSGRRVTIVMDCDDAGRSAARRIAADLNAGASPRIVDLRPGRDDGYDLTDWLGEAPEDPRNL